MMMRILMLCVAVAVASPSWAVEEDYLPPPPPKVPYDGERPADADAVKPDIRIIEKDDAMITEYRVNGQLYAIKIQPKVGPAYYLYDDNGNGVLDRRRDLGQTPGANYWRIFSW